MIVHAYLRQASKGQRDAPEPESRHVQVEAELYEVGRDQITADLPRRLDRGQLETRPMTG